jgi:hypothetical protein
LAFTYCTKNPAAKKAATSSCGRYNIVEITSANAFYSKTAADRKVEPPIPHSPSLTQPSGAACDATLVRKVHQTLRSHEFAGAMEGMRQTNTGLTTPPDFDG